MGGWSEMLKFSGAAENLGIQKDVREIELHLGRNAALNPVVNTLDAAFLLKRKQLGNFRWATKAGDEFFVIHAHITHLV